MKTYSKAILVGLSLIFSLLLVARPFAIQGPRISIKKASFDFGEVKEGRVLEHSFLILNKGDQPLKIEKVRPG